MVWRYVYQHLTYLLVDLVVDLKRDVTIDEVNQAFIEASENELKGIMEFTMEPLFPVISKQILTLQSSMVYQR